MPRGSLASLACQPVDLGEAAAKLKPDEVLVAVKAVGINFRQAWCSRLAWGQCCISTEREQRLA